jgi:hypothetical protein
MTRELTSLSAALGGDWKTAATQLSKLKEQQLDDLLDKVDAWRPYSYACFLPIAWVAMSDLFHRGCCRVASTDPLSDVVIVLKRELSFREWQKAEIAWDYFNSRWEKFCEDKRYRKVTDRLLDRLLPRLLGTYSAALTWNIGRVIPLRFVDTERRVLAAFNLHLQARNSVRDRDESRALFASGFGDQATNVLGEESGFTPTAFSFAAFSLAASAVVNSARSGLYVNPDAVSACQAGEWQGTARWACQLMQELESRISQVGLDTIESSSSSDSPTTRRTR